MESFFFIFNLVFYLQDELFTKNGNFWEFSKCQNSELIHLIDRKLKRKWKQIRCIELDMVFIFIKLHLFYLYHINWTTENIFQNDFYSKKNEKKTLKTGFFLVIIFFWFFIHKKNEKNHPKKTGCNTSVDCR